MFFYFCSLNTLGLSITYRQSYHLLCREKQKTQHKLGF
ncbi:hypothetical protein CZ797_08010 [Pseudoalteromonas sp. JB197]|nr:hypothetical protein CZ797_08010 [Pseudoalteromonas sp. JB197]